jgi:hypothetical protein
MQLARLALWEMTTMAARPGPAQEWLPALVAPFVALFVAPMSRSNQLWTKARVAHWGL